MSFYAGNSSKFGTVFLNFFSEHYESHQKYDIIKVIIMKEEEEEEEMEGAAEARREE